MWYRDTIGHNHCPIVDTWWQTETGGIMISPLPGVTATKPGSAMTPLPGISATVVNDEGVPVGKGEGGYLVIDKPWPGMLRTIFGDDERFTDTYWSRFAAQGYYFAGDGAKYDTDGALWLLGRVDDVMNISGHRISTTEVESALVSHPSVAEAAVVGAADDMTGQGIVAFVILRGSAMRRDTDVLVAELKTHVAKEIGPIARPKRILVVPELPKTRSGKIMRRLLRDIAENREVGDASTLQDTNVLGLITSGSVRSEHRTDSTTSTAPDGAGERRPKPAGAPIVVSTCRTPRPAHENLSARWTSKGSPARPGQRPGYPDRASRTGGAGAQCGTA